MSLTLINVKPSVRGEHYGRRELKCTAAPVGSSQSSAEEGNGADIPPAQARGVTNHQIAGDARRGSRRRKGGAGGRCPSRRRTGCPGRAELEGTGSANPSQRRGQCQSFRSDSQWCRATTRGGWPPCGGNRPNQRSRQSAGHCGDDCESCCGWESGNALPDFCEQSVAVRFRTFLQFLI